MRDEGPDVQTEGRRIEDWLARGRDWGNEGPWRAVVGGGGAATAAPTALAPAPAPAPARCLAVVSWSRTLSDR